MLESSRYWLLATMADNLISVRAGSDPRVVHYLWRKLSDNEVLFGAALESLIRDRLVVVLSGEDRPIRLSDAGLEMLLESRTSAADAAAEGLASLKPLTGKERPVDDIVAMLKSIFFTLRPPAGSTVSAVTLARIWQLEKMRGADLRKSLDQLIADGYLELLRDPAGNQFVITAAGAKNLL